MNTGDPSQEVVLLGAGASADAGIPITRDMAPRIVEELPYDLQPALRFAVGGLLFNEGIAGNNPFSGVDVEALFTAIQLLSRRGELEVAPFVTWHYRIDELEAPRRDEPHPFMRLVTQLQRMNDPESAMHPSDVELMHEFDQAFEQAFESGPRYPVFDILAERMLRILEKVLTVDVDRTSYLSPLVTQARGNRGFTIATLNYDTTIEQAASELDISVSVGLRAWESQGEVAFPDGDLNLLKLHGSIDWVSREMAAGSSTSPMPSSRIEVGKSPTATEPPALIFGSGAKLRAEGPFLKLFAKFEERLAQAERLTVIGYSFRDEHVNHAIGSWLNGRTSRCIRIVNRSRPFPRASEFTRHLDLLLRNEPTRAEFRKATAAEALPDLWT